MAGIVKIGATTHDPAARLADANSADTWRPPEPYELVCSAHVPSAFATERALHTILGARRINARREFFRASYVEARNLFALLAEGCSQPSGEGPVVAVDDETPSAASDTVHPVRVWASPVPRMGSGPGQSQLRSWVESSYTHVPLREKDTGTKLEALYASYFSTAPPVHQKILGRNTFAKMLISIYPGVGPHRNLANTVSGIYLLQVAPKRATQSLPPAAESSESTCGM
jgi:hypothetical protein